MEFSDNEAIYLQIAAMVCDNILLRKWAAEQRIPSVRELATELEVNPNTVMRSYEYLQNQQIVYNKRGLGLFVMPDAYETVKKLRRESFLQQNLRALFKNMMLLDISMDDIAKQYQDFEQEYNRIIIDYQKDENK